ncbi:MAG: DEAD/DEAH box helicase [Candidatus Verstraetearchaeota archaeon]|nr:DEAD/DEAH box helicase [Candidatus Verstraetearchaeota archaeon]
MKELYPPQEEAIKIGVLDGKNVLLAVPTASGKTLVAILCSIKHVLEKKGKVLYLVPLKALANEKFEEFKSLEKIGIKVTFSTSDYDKVDPSLENYDIIIATNEKADSIIRHKPNWINKISLIVVDEIHLLGEPSRGPTLEVLLTSLRILNPNAQIIALSATIKNASEIAEWLKAIPINSNWRPIPLKEGVFLRDTILFKNGSIVKIYEKEKDSVIALTLDCLRQGGQVLIFTGSRASAVSLAKKLSESVGRFLKNEEIKKLMELSSKILGLGERTRISETLSKLISYGVAFHHAGLTYEQRKLIENAFRSSLIKCICATPTLAAGVNLPARRVIIYDYKRYEPGVGQVEIPIMEEKQMAGRAGRPKYDKEGEAILIAKNENEMEFLFEEYVLANPEKIWSKLGTSSSLRAHILAIIATNLVNYEEEIFEFFTKTLFAHQYGLNNFNKKISNVLNLLIKEDLVENSKGKLRATKFGKRVAELYIDPETAIIIRDGLNSPPLSTMEYLLLICQTPDMPGLPFRKKDLSIINEFINNEIQYEDPEFLAKLEKIKVALMLNSWINEEPEDKIIEKFDVGSGDIYSYVETAKWLLHSAYELAKLFNYEKHLIPLNKLYLRIENGVKEELIPLVSLRGIGRVRARALYSAGFKTIEDLRKAEISDLIKIPQIGPETAKLIKEQVGYNEIKKQLTIDNW